MSVMQQERRRHARVPMEGMMCWRSDRGAGTCRICDISPEGAAFLLPTEVSNRMSRHLALDMPLGDGVQWTVAEDARVIRKSYENEVDSRIAVHFRNPG